LVRPADHAGPPRADPEVVLSDVPAPRMGTDTCRGVRPLSHPDSQTRVDVPTRLPITRRDWQRVLGDLAAQLADGRIYDRELPDLATAIDAVLQAWSRARTSGAGLENGPGQ
jgi:hypothetical protein